MVWILENAGKKIETFATDRSISLDDAIDMCGITVDEEEIFYDDLSLRLATDEEKEDWYKEEA